jgi:hypothetical protein
MSDPIYPFAIEPHERELIWGGDALVKRFGKSAAPGRDDRRVVGVLRREQAVAQRRVRGHRRSPHCARVSGTRSMGDARSGRALSRS